MEATHDTKKYARLVAGESCPGKLSVRENGLSYLVDLEEELEDALVAIADEHDAMVDERETLEIGLEKTDIRVAEARLVWVPVA